MQIKEYLFYNRLSKAKFAELAGVHRQTIDNITTGRSKVFRSDVMVKIREATKGEVIYEDMLEEAQGIFPSYRKA